MMARIDELPVAVIGAGPVGLAAAAHLVQRGIRPLILERGAEVGASLSEWAHVRVFSPWTYNIDIAARSMLEASGWTSPDATALPTGGELVAQYLKPLAALPSIATTLSSAQRSPPLRARAATRSGRPIGRRRRSSFATSMRPAPSSGRAPEPSSTRPAPGRSPIRSASMASAYRAKRHRRRSSPMAFPM